MDLAFQRPGAFACEGHRLGVATKTAWGPVTSLAGLLVRMTSDTGTSSTVRIFRGDTASAGPADSVHASRAAFAGVRRKLIGSKVVWTGYLRIPGTRPEMNFCIQSPDPSKTPIMPMKIMPLSGGSHSHRHTKRPPCGSSVQPPFGASDISGDGQGVPSRRLTQPSTEKLLSGLISRLRE